jgi:hypothetical protein
MENGQKPGQTITPAPPAGDGSAPAAPAEALAAQQPAAQSPAPAGPAAAPPSGPAAAPPSDAAPPAAGQSVPVPGQPDARQPAAPAEAAPAHAAPDAADAAPEEDGGFYTDDPDAARTPNRAAVTWTASEFIAHAKSLGWYVVLVAGTAVFAAAVYLLTRDRISVVVIVVAALLLGVYANHKPRQMEYRLDGRGLTIGDKHFSYDQFRSFSVLPEGAFSSIVFMPLKRFALTTTIYYAPEDEDKIVNLLSDHLPLDERGHDAIDRLMHRIRF